jgi:hypothetical protein
MTSVPASLQIELAMLWRTLSIIENVEGLSVVDFYEKYTPTLQAMPALSLSSYWTEASRLTGRMKASGSDLHCLVGIRTANNNGTDGHAEAKRSDSVINIPELDYLRHINQIDLKHDPLSIVQNIYGAAASIILDASPYNRSILLSACTALAAKSGRASLLLHLISLLATLAPSNSDQDEQYVSVDLDPLKDLCANIQRGNESPELPATAREEPLDVPADPLAESALLEASVGSGTSRILSKERSGILLSFGKADHGKQKLVQTSVSMRS